MNDGGGGSAPDGVASSHVARPTPVSGNAGIEGLPEAVTVADRGLLRAAERGAFRMEAAPGRRPDTYEIHVHPDGGGVSYVSRGSRQSVAWYDPELGDLETLDAGEILERTIVRPRPGLLDTLDVARERGLIYRGVAFEEFVSLLRTGEIRTKGEYNLAGQEGMTCWGTDARTAASYACSFAPMAFKPTFRRPAFVVAARMPAETAHLPGMGDNEIGVTRPIRLDEIVAAWRGRVFDFDPGRIDLVPHGDAHLTGSAVMPSARVVWDRIHPDGPLVELAARLGVTLPQASSGGDADPEVPAAPRR